MARKTLVLLASVGFALSSGVALAAGDCGSFHVNTSSKQTVASADQDSTPVVVPKPKDG